ncbi:hypothetical protein Fmac_026596 [Flemingia macrophylla]|uniref:Uncharacterized protein n=1 Tax=Flemingia macrophylla TaxID=520843 RepID=A0ABD1LFH5_9FABA
MKSESGGGSDSECSSSSSERSSGGASTSSRSSGGSEDSGSTEAKQREQWVLSLIGKITPTPTPHQVNLGPVVVPTYEWVDGSVGVYQSWYGYEAGLKSLFKHVHVVTFLTGTDPIHFPPQQQQPEPTPQDPNAMSLDEPTQEEQHQQQDPEEEVEDEDEEDDLQKPETLEEDQPHT